MQHLCFSLCLLVIFLHILNKQCMWLQILYLNDYTCPLFSSLTPGVYAAELLASNKLSELACLALYLMYEKKQGKKSFWYPYIRELDRQRGRGQLAVESPLLWSESELGYLTGSPTKVLPSGNLCHIVLRWKLWYLVHMYVFNALFTIF